MLPHSAHTVLATIFWTILLGDPAKAGITGISSVPVLGKDSVSLQERRLINSVLVYATETILDETKNVETRFYEDDEEISSGNDTVAEIGAFEKHRVPEAKIPEVARSPISLGNLKTYTETVKYQDGDNNAEHILQPRIPAPFISMLRGENFTRDGMERDVITFEHYGSNVSMPESAKFIEMENDTESNEKSSGQSAIDGKETSNLARSRANTFSMVVKANASELISQDKNSNVDTGGYWDETTWRVNRSNEELPYSSSSIGNSQEDQASDTEARAPSTNREINGREVFWLKKSEKTVYESTERSDDPNGVQKSLDGLGIFYFREKGKATVPRRVQNSSVASNASETVDQQMTRSYIPVGLRTNGYHDATGASTFSAIPTNLLENVTNRLVSDSSMDHENIEFVPGVESSPETSKGLSGALLDLSSNLGFAMRTDSSSGKTDGDCAKDTTSPSVGYTLRTGAWKKLYKPGTRGPQGQQRKLEEKNYPGGVGDLTASPLVSMVDDTDKRDIEKLGITVRSSDGSGKISEAKSFVDRRNNTEFKRTIASSFDKGISPGILEYADNPSRLDTQTRVHGEVVKSELAGLQRDREAHKTFIGQKYGDIVRGSYQRLDERVQVQEKFQKHGKNVTRYKNTVGMNESFLGTKDEAKVAGRELVLNSEAFTWLLLKRENNLLDSITGAIAEDVTRKMATSDSVRNTRDSRKIKISRDRLTRFMFSKASEMIVPGSVQFLRATATENGASSDHGVPENRENFIRQIFQTTPGVASLSIATEKVDAWDFASDKEENGYHLRDGKRETGAVTRSPGFPDTLDETFFRESPQVDKEEKFQSVDDLSARNPPDRPTSPGTASASTDSRNQLRSSERLAAQRNQMNQELGESKNRESKTKESSSSIPRSSENRQSVGSRESLDIHRDHSKEAILNVTGCEMCEFAEISGKEAKAERSEYILANSQRSSDKKIAPSINGGNSSMSLNDNEKTRGNEDSYESEFINARDESLARVASKPDERVSKRVERENNGSTIFQRGRIAAGSSEDDLIVSDEEPSGMLGSLRKIKKLRVMKEPDVPIDKTSDQGIEASLAPSHEYKTPGSSSAESGSTSNESTPVNELSTFDEAFVARNSGKSSDNANDISWNSEKWWLQSDSREKHSTTSARLMMDPFSETATWTWKKSMKIDSPAIGGLERKKPAQPSHMWPGANLGDVVGRYKAKQMKRGFTSQDGGSFFIVKATPRPYNDNGANTESGVSPDAKPASLRDDYSGTSQIWTRHPSIFHPVDGSDDDQPPSSGLSTVFPEDSVSSDTIDALTNSSHRTGEPFASKVNESLAGLPNIDDWNTNRMNPSPRSTPVLPMDSFDSTSTSKSLDNLQIGFHEKNGENSSATTIGNATMQDNSTRLATTLNQWPVKHSAVVEGDLVLGGLMMVHEREDSVTCGPVMPQGGVQALEAMLYTLDWLNERDLVPGVKIGAHILDDCDKDTYGLEMAVDFIKGSISNIDGAEYHCNKTAVRKVISGVVGAASSVTSIQVANLLRLFRIPQVSFFSTSPELSNKMRFEYFTRTIPSDHYQVKAMVDIVLVMGWSYVSIIYEESNYGEKAYEELEKLLGKHQICIAVKEKLSKDSGVAEAYVYDNIVQKLLTKPRARGCIIFASDQEVAGVMRAVRRCNATGAFSWIGSDGWSARSLVSDGNEREMEGTLSVQPQANPVKGFEDYFLNLTVENNRRNPWFVEFWEDHFKCRYPNSSRTPYNNYTRECTTSERLTRENTAFEDQLQFVSDAVLAFAHAFRNMHGQLCHGKPGLCDAMRPTKGTELLNYLRTVEFHGLSGDVFHFDKNGDGPARYNIIHFKQISPGEYKWIRVGEYLEGELRLDMSEIQFRLGHPEAPESVCSLPCEVGQAKKYVEGESCCWHCFNCSQDEIRHASDEKQCVPCPKGTLPDETHSYCRAIPEEFLRPESGWAIGAMSFSSTGILITLFVGGVFLKHNDTPIVRASGRELSYVLLTGILLCYLITFALVLRPTDLVCSIQRFSAGFCFTVMYAALLTKTNRISRIFNAGKRSAKRPSFISPRSQLIICSMLVAVQILINAVWMVIDPAKARHHYPTREDNLLVCNSYIDASYMIAFTYPIILIVVCTVYAVLTRKIPEAFNESKHIGFTMYTTCVIWLAFVPLYFATGSHVALRITSMSVTISLSATVTIACLFTPKLYIILIHPERNVRPNMMHHRYNTTKGSVVTATNASSMMAPVTLTAVTCDQNRAVKKHTVTTTDCSTQSEHHDIELKERINGKIPASTTSRSTQTSLNNNGKEIESPTIIKDIPVEDSTVGARVTTHGIGKIGNGPLNSNEVPL